MSHGINKVIVMGNIGQDPFNSTLPSGQAITKISVATKRNWKNAEGSPQEHTEWHPVCFFDRLAEIASRFLKKGSRVFVEGYLKTSKWEDKQGVSRYKTEIIGTNLQLMDPKYNEEESDEGSKILVEPAVSKTEIKDESYDDLPF